MKPLLPPPDFNDPLDGCDPATPFQGLAVEGSFISGDKNPQLMRIRYFKRRADATLMAKVWFGPHAEGPPGHAHGGSMAALLDEGMGAAAWLAGYPVLAAKISINFRNKLPLGTVGIFEATLTRIEGKKIFTVARLVGSRGELFCEGEGLFILIPEKDVIRKQNL